MRRVPPRPVAVVLACLMTLAMTAGACDDGPSDVALGEAGRATVVEVVDAPAAVTARAAATLTAPADGTLVALRVGAGGRVAAGQVIAVVDSPTAQDRLDSARAALVAARRGGGGFGGGSGAGLGRARRETDRAARAAFLAARQAAGRIADSRQRGAMLAQVTVAERQYDAAAEAAGAAIRAVQRGVAGLGAAVEALGTAQRLQAEQAYELARSTVDALVLRAPIAGVVQLGGAAAGGTGGTSLTDLLSAATGAGRGPGAGPAAAPGVAPAAPLPGVDGAVGVGGLVTAGTAIVTVVDTSELGLLAEVDETDVLLVKPGVSAAVELDAANGARYPATVRSVDILPTPSARGGVSYRVRLALGKGTYPEGRTAPVPRPGMSAVARLTVRRAADAVTVPAAAVFSADGRDAVWTVRDGRAQRVEVTVGVQGPDLVQILGGVADGQQVVVRGTDQVSAGQRVS